jgi:hypothetical protein
VADTCHQPLITVNATIAAVVRSIGADPPTLLVDEADTLWGSKKQADNNEDLRGLLNAGHQRNRPMLRWDITTRTLDRLDTFAMAMLAAIGELPDTIMDRAVVVRMRRRAPGERVDPYRTRRDAHPSTRYATASPAGHASTSTRSTTPPRRCRWRTAPPTPGNPWSPSPTSPPATGPSAPAPPRP